MLVSVDRAEKALIYMAETDERFAKYKADLERYQYICKRTRAAMFLAQDTGSVEQKKAVAEVSAEVRDAEEDVSHGVDTGVHLAVEVVSRGNVSCVAKGAVEKIPRNVSQ